MDAGSPWAFYKDTIHTLILDGPITAIGDQAFYACNNLRYIDFGDSLVEIGNQAFYSCNALEAIRLPVSFRKFGPECFRDCSGLQVVYCEGPMPSFKASCLYNDQTVSVFYPATAPWPQEEVQRLMSNFGARLSVNAGTPEVLEDYLEDADFTVPETLPPETTVPETTVPETTEATIPETTIPETIPTVPATEAAAPEMPEEEPVFQLESEPLFVTEPEHAPSPAEVSQETSGNLSYGIWILIAAAAITGLLILALLIRIIARGGHGRYED